MHGLVWKVWTKMSESFVYYRSLVRDYWTAASAIKL